MVIRLECLKPLIKKWWTVPLKLILETKEIKIKKGTIFLEHAFQFYQMKLHEMRQQFQIFANLTKFYEISKIEMSQILPYLADRKLNKGPSFIPWFGDTCFYINNSCDVL